MASPTARLLIEVATKGAQKEVNDLEKAERKLVDTSKQVQKTGMLVRDEMGRMVTTTDRATKATTRLDKATRSSGKAASVMLGAFRPLLAGLTAYAGISRTISTITSFETAMASLRGVTGATGEELALLTRTARDAGATTRYTAGQAAEGLLELARAGLSVREQSVALRPSLDLATAGMMSLAESSDLVTNVAAQFRLPTTQIQRIGDVLVATANRSNTNVAQLGQALKDVGVVASNMGTSLEETNAALGVLANRGLKGSDGAIKLRQAFLQLIAPSAEAVTLLGDMGLSLQDVDIRSQGLEKVLRNLAKAQTDIGKAATLVGARNAAALVSLTESVDEFARLRDEVMNAEGEMKKFADALDDTVVGSWKALNSAIDEFILSAGDAGVSGAIRGLIGIFTDLVRGLNDSKGAFEDATSAANAFGISLGKVADGWGMVFDAMSEATEYWKKNGFGMPMVGEQRSYRGAPARSGTSIFELGRRIGGTLNTDFGSGGSGDNPFSRTYPSPWSFGDQVGTVQPGGSMSGRGGVLDGFFGGGGGLDPWGEGGPGGDGLVRAVGDFREAIEKTTPEIDEFKQGMANAVAGGIGDVFRSLKDNGDIGQALADGLQSMTDRMFENSVQFLENQIAGALGGALGVPVAATPGEQAIVSAVQRVEAAVYSTGATDGAGAGGGGAAAGGMGFAGSLAMAGVGIGMSLLMSRLGQRGGSEGGGRDGPGFNVRGPGGVTINDYSRTTIQSAGNPRQTAQTLRMSQENKFNRWGR